MARTKSRRKPLATIWEVSDDLWRRIEPILLDFWPKKPTGRRVANWRVMINGIIFRMRSGCQWNGTEITSRFAWNLVSSPRIGAQPGGVQHGRLCTENRTDDEAALRLAG
jgi:transposase